MLRYATSNSRSILTTAAQLLPPLLYERETKTMRLQGAALVALLILTSAAATTSFAADPGVLRNGGTTSICTAGFSPNPEGYNPKTGGVAYTCTQDSAPKCAAGLALEANAAGSAALRRK